MRWWLSKLDFPYLLGELAIVIIGVLIALAVDRWKEDQDDEGTTVPILSVGDRFSRVDLTAASILSLFSRPTQMKARAGLRCLFMMFFFYWSIRRSRYRSRTKGELSLSLSAAGRG